MATTTQLGPDRSMELFSFDFLLRETGGHIRHYFTTGFVLIDRAAVHASGG